MQAWKIKYCQVERPDARWTAGILANTKEDALRHLSTVVKFAYQVENIEFLGEIHAITESVLMSIIKTRQGERPAETTQKKQEQAQKEEDLSLIEDELQSGEIECQFCGRVCKGKIALQNHESRCKSNPEYAKLEQARQDKKKQKLAQQEEN